MKKSIKKVEDAKDEAERVVNAWSLVKSDTEVDVSDKRWMSWKYGFSSDTQTIGPETLEFADMEWSAYLTEKSLMAIHIADDTVFVLYHGYPEKWDTRFKNLLEKGEEISEEDLEVPTEPPEVAFVSSVPGENKPQEYATLLNMFWRGVEVDQNSPIPDYENDYSFGEEGPVYGHQEMEYNEEEWTCFINAEGDLHAFCTLNNGVLTLYDGDGSPQPQFENMRSACEDAA